MPDIALLLRSTAMRILEFPSLHDPQRHLHPQPSAHPINVRMEVIIRFCARSRDIKYIPMSAYVIRSVNTKPPVAVL